ncbi:hypothetical protein [Streptomyces sudanensis]|uniref:hypothetical protein n=1 Tax=Streptomyces sudanensis TaxID=436397 RepID=UPI0020CEDE58|nr:hypothetical protein [Streptomyces sudanensis]MCP9999612.1 hypothetical protein [Streptomyces sudanensis]
MRRTGGRRVALLCALLVVAGSPWVRDVLLDAWAGEGGGGMAMVYRALFAQGWEPSPGSDPYMRVSDLRGNVAFPVLLAGVVLLVPRLVGRAPAARGVRFAAAVGTGVLLSLVAAVASWAVVVSTDPAAVLVFGRSAGEAFTLFAVDGLVFGTLLGLLIAAVHTGAGTAPQAGAARGASAGDAPAAGGAAAPAATGTEPGDATRYLCAAAYTDPAFARRVVDGVLGDRLGAIAVSPGVDLVPVARHSLTARRLRRERDRRLAVAYGVIALSGPLWLLFARLVLSSLAAASTAPVPYPAVRGRHLPRPSVWRLVSAVAGLTAAGVLAGAALSALPCRASSAGWSAATGTACRRCWPWRWAPDWRCGRCSARRPTSTPGCGARCGAARSTRTDCPGRARWSPGRPPGSRRWPTPSGATSAATAASPRSSATAGGSRSGRCRCRCCPPSPSGPSPASTPGTWSPGCAAGWRRPPARSPRPPCPAPGAGRN